MHAYAPPFGYLGFSCTHPHPCVIDERIVLFMSFLLTLVASSHMGKAWDKGYCTLTWINGYEGQSPKDSGQRPGLGNGPGQGGLRLGSLKRIEPK
jgi:hypothetical protein